MESNHYLYQEAVDGLTRKMQQQIYGTYATVTTNQFQPAGQEYVRERCGGSSIQNEDARIMTEVDVVADSSAIPRTNQNIYCGIEPRDIIENVLSSSSRQNSDRGSPASSDGQILLHYELYNPSSSSTSTLHATSISDFTPSLSTYERPEQLVENPAIKQHFWTQRTQITPTKALNCYVTETFNHGVITFFCAWPECNHPIGFAHKAQVITHVRSAHLQEKPYVCTTCNTTFARKQDANRHVVSLNRGKQYRCSVCHRAYSRKHYRNEHEERCLLEALSGSPDTRV